MKAAVRQDNFALKADEVKHRLWLITTTATWLLITNFICYKVDLAAIAERKRIKRQQEKERLKLRALEDQAELIKKKTQVPLFFKSAVIECYFIYTCVWYVLCARTLLGTRRGPRLAYRMLFRLHESFEVDHLVVWSLLVCLLCL